MQTIPAIMQITRTGAKWCDEFGNLTDDPVGYIGVATQIAIDLRAQSATGENIPPAYDYASLAAAASWYVALDDDYDATTTPILINVTGITVAQDADDMTILTVPLPSTLHAGLIAAVETEESVSLKLEIGALDSGGETLFLAQSNITIHNRVWTPTGSPPAGEGAPEYYSSAESIALFVPKKVTLTTLTGTDVSVAPGTHCLWSATGACTIANAEGWAATGREWARVDIALAAGGAVTAAVGSDVTIVGTIAADATTRCLLESTDGAIALYVL